MAGPWEKYQDQPAPAPAAKPWEKYASSSQPQPRKKTMTADEIVKMGMGAAQTATEQFTPAKRKPTERKASGPSDWFAPTAERKAAFKAGSKAAVAGFSRGFGFSAPEYASAAIEYIIPEKYHPGGKKGSTFAEQLNMHRAWANRAQAEAPKAALIANLAGGVQTGAAATGALTKAGAALTSKTAPAANALGNILTGSQTLKKGETVKNAAKLAATGAAFGGAQAYGEGQPVTSAMAYGAAIPVAIVGGGKLASWAGHHVADVLGMSSLGGILKRFTNMTKEELAAKRADFVKKTGTEPTVMEILSLEDRRRLQAITGRSHNTQEAALEATQARVAAIPDELASKTRAITKPAVRSVQQGIATDLAASRGAVPEAADVRAAISASKAPLDMREVAKTEARNIMAPHDPKILFGGIDELIPTQLRSIPQPDLPPKYTDKHIPEGDTRGAGVQYHGARGNVPELKEGYSNPANIYGGNETFYTTDAADIASGYQRKSAAGTVYKTEERVPVNKFDMEQRITPEEASALFGHDDLSDLAISEALGQDGKINLREAMDEIRHLSQGEGYSRDDVQEIFDAAIYNLRQKGFGAMTHTGGLKTGKTPHNVAIYFDAPNQIKLTPLEKATATPRPPKIEETIRDPEVTAAIRGAAGTLRLRPQGEGISGKETSQLLSELRERAWRGKGTIEGDNAQAAINHIEDLMIAEHPDVAADVIRMREAFAARLRMLEGQGEGALTRSRNQVSDGSDAANQRALNAYDTPEGTAGRVLGQTNRLVDDFGSGSALGAAEDIVRSRNTQRALSRNIGSDESQAITEMAGAQTQSVRNLASLAKEGAIDGADSMSAGDLGTVIAGLNPSSMATTKARLAVRMVKVLRLPESKAMALTDMLLSQDPTKAARALNMLRTNKQVDDAFLRQMLISAVGGSKGSSVSGFMNTPQGEPSAFPASPDEIPVEDVAPDEAMPEDGESPYAADLEQIYSTESPEFLDLIDRQFQQESGHRQFGSDGQPLTSSAGAIGVAQVMPGTAPIAAEMAGLPYDEQAYRTDPAYNKMLGMAYMSNMLQRYDGNVALALAAYNAGPGRVDKALSRGENWFAHLPAETQNYVQAIL